MTKPRASQFTKAGVNMKGRRGQLRHSKLPMYFLLLLLLLVGCGKDDGPPKITQEEIDEITEQINTAVAVKLQVDNYTQHLNGTRDIEPYILLSYDFNNSEVLSYYTYEYTDDWQLTVLENLQLNYTPEDSYDLLCKFCSDLGFDLSKCVKEESLQGDNISKSYTIHDGLTQVMVGITDDNEIDTILYQSADEESGALHCVKLWCNYFDDSALNGGTCGCGCGGTVDECGPDCEVNGDDDA